MTKQMKKLLKAAVLIVEFTVCAAFTFSTCLLYYTLIHQTPVPNERQLDNDFVPLVLLILLAAGAFVFGVAFCVHFAFRLIKRAGNKPEVVNHLK